MRSVLKDYYLILEVAPIADNAEIKKSFRRLAFKYHPDTNPENRFANTMFQEVQEAYSILSDPDKRRQYDEERWLSGMNKRIQQQQIISPAWILAECRKLHKHMLGVDTYRMDHSALQEYIFLLLSDIHIAVLQKHNDNDTNNHIVQLLLAATRHLRHPYMAMVGDRLRLISDQNDALLQVRIDNQIAQSEKTAAWSRYTPWIILLVTLILCVVMYVWVH